MAESLGVLGQAYPAANTLTDLYAPAADAQASVSTLTACNQASQRASFRVSVARAGAADNRKQYLFYDVAVDGNRTYAATIGIALKATDMVRVLSSNGQISFNLFGVEVT